MKIDYFNFENLSEFFDENRFEFGKQDLGYGIYKGMIDIETKKPNGLGRIIWKNHK